MVRKKEAVKSGIERKKRDRQREGQIERARKFEREGKRREIETEKKQRDKRRERSREAQRKNELEGQREQKR